MVVDPWIFWLILAPIAATSALALGALALLVLGVLAATIGLGVRLAWDGMHPAVHWLAACSARGLRLVVSPAKHCGPWLDYVVTVVAGIGLALLVGGLLWLAE